MKFSIVTASYQQLDWLKLCVQSVSDQKGDFEVEHLIQDGGSGPEFDEWAKVSAPPNWVSEPDQGMYDAINRGFIRAQGEILAWLNSDEQYLPGALARVAKAFKENPKCDLLFGDVVVTVPDGTPVAYRKALMPWRSYIRSCHLPTFSAAAFVRRSLLDQCGLLDTRWRTIADAVWVDQLLSKARPIILNEPLAVFSQTGENLGMTSEAGKELQRWRGECGTQSKIRREVLSAVHRIRKLLSLSYQGKNRRIKLYLPGSASRIERSAIVSERWPKKLGSSYYADDTSAGR